MINIGQKIVSLVLLGTTTSLMALYSEQASLYKDPRVMGMGGANIAVGSYSTAVFYNPAGLANIKKEHGFVIDLLGVGASGTADIQGFVDDLGSADTEADMLGVLEQYNGQPFHIGVDNYTSISKNSDGVAWTIGFLAAADLNFMSHTNGGPGLLDTSSRAYGGVIVGFAKPYETEYGRLDIGISGKYISQQSYEATLTMTELLSENIADDLQAKYEKKSTGYGIDLGINYQPWVDNYWHLAVGMSVMNLGNMDMDNNYGKQPTTLNFGMSITPEVPIFDKFVFAVDYVDALEANQLRIYSISEADNSLIVTDYDQSDFMKRLRMGVGMGLVDTSLFSLTLNGGWYQSAYTAGVNMEMLLFKLNVATYQEEIGSATTPVGDRRYMLQAGIGW